MTTTTIRGVPVKFPFKPYDIQRDYMEKVLECLQKETNGVLESPTGTGKTLSLLCSTMAWLELKKAQVQAQCAMLRNDDLPKQQSHEWLQDIAGKEVDTRALSGLPTIIYSSRTHAQLSQAMQELKRTAYSYMKASVMGSRDQLCIHPELVNEENRNLKQQMCQLKVSTRSCNFHNRVEKKKEDPLIRDINVMDIEDLVKLGKAHKFCPFYMSKELNKFADIIFMPYNYLLDPMIRKSLGNIIPKSVIILDEGHNVEKNCEDAASLQIKSSDLTLAIEEVTAIMKMISEESLPFDDSPKDFSPDDLCNLKQVFLNIEKEIDQIPLKGPDGVNLEGTFLLDLFARAGVTFENVSGLSALISCVVQFLATVNEGPFARKGNNLQNFQDIFQIVFISPLEEFREKIRKCYKVHVKEEEVRKKRQGNWLSKASKAGGRILNYWCFSPGFGMNMLMSLGMRSLILTSGTLAPLKPLISELELDIQVRLENPHIVTGEQVCVKVVTAGPDSEEFNCNYQNRDNPKYISSLGRAILNLTRIVPNGLLIFCPSYPIMTKCQQVWQETGIWGDINSQKTIYVEPRDKNSFNSAMHDYCEKVNDPNLKGAIFMGVCRGKVAEGLDFADGNGRAVIIIGLPYPPLKDPRVILKRKYLDVCNARDREYLKGEEWYSLEASRAVNQAIGRVIRHKDDYGAILLFDTRFNNPRIRSQMSMWLRNHIKTVNKFGELMRDLRQFFIKAAVNFPLTDKSTRLASTDYGTSSPNKDGCCSSNLFSEASTSSLDLGNDGEVSIHKRPRLNLPPQKRMKINLVPNVSNPSVTSETTTKEYILMVKKNLDVDSFRGFTEALKLYKECERVDLLIGKLEEIFQHRQHLRYLIPGLETYIRTYHMAEFSKYCKINGLLD
ncbi:unnamed protein product [Phaedon cochleariae]|uniref:Regulator of telomere elongation helicase 1 homolog n=1 Tax=Phaedon cochleariae TaxID=80249 RepID=A0A9N9X4N4_PHACE|nr:unnamed protein product [Phaedon cochleariae]